MPDSDPIAIVREYHNQSKHQFNRFARSLGYLDWATQPDPFRAYDGAPLVDLVESLRAVRDGAWAHAGYDELFVPGSPDASTVSVSPSASAAPSGPAAPRVAPGRSAVSVFLRFSLGLSAWKQAGPSRWALRVNPSSGNLHPTEGYIVAGPGVVTAHAGVSHYAPDAHALHDRCVMDGEAYTRAMDALPDGAFLAGLTSIHWREAWKYGERAFRYCQHDVGHAIAAMRMAAAMMGWEFRLVRGWSSAQIGTLLGTDRDGDFVDVEREEPACLAVVSPRLFEGAPLPSLADAARRGAWSGRASRLSPNRVQWDWIDTVAEAARDDGRVRPSGDGPGQGAAGPTGVPPRSRWARSHDVAVPAHRLLLQRRSAQSMDGRSSLDRDRFITMLRRVLPNAGPPFDAFGWDPRIHLALFVHRVDGVAPGLYALVRENQTRTDFSAAENQSGTDFRANFSQDFAWVHPEGIPEDLPLYLLAPVDARRIARQLSCSQDIAADGFFSLGMLAEFDRTLEERGPSGYRELFWEAGAIGHALYLEAEAAGARGTGIGCFFDDGVHEMLGIADSRLQSLYHFTVGIPVDDSRLTTAPGYPWE